MIALRERVPLVCVWPQIRAERILFGSRLRREHTNLFRYDISTFSSCIKCNGNGKAEPLDTRLPPDPNRIMFPDEINARSLDLPIKPPPSPEPEEKSLIPLNLTRKLSSVTTVEEFLQLVKGVPLQQNTFSIQSKIGETEERSNAEIPVPATCKLELQTVQLHLDTDTTSIYFPTYIRINRCGGCCYNSLLSCQPTATETRNLEIYVMTTDHHKGLVYRSKRIVPVEEHTQCECNCKIKEEHCNKKQTYVPESCKCQCNDVDEKKKCNESDKKVWNLDLCSCSCREVRQCCTGLYFDQNACSTCRQSQISRPWLIPTRRIDYGFEYGEKSNNVSPVIIALDTDDPRRKPKPDPEFK
ncbi:uncharacterized protein LOC143221471 [Lasioglossum baleicum]|uniref:uncharacterized protein LOC143221471 n=1 Tax=Lasioglossum baleicum TaxID=434251 RepID=UPI003FCE40F8